MVADRTTYWPGTNIPKSQGDAFTAHLNHQPEQPIETRVCTTCQKEKRVTAFGVGSKKCSACYSREKREQGKQVQRVDLSPTPLFEIDVRNVCHVYSKA